MSVINREAVLAIIESRRDKLDPASRIDIVTNLVLNELRDAVLLLPETPAVTAVEDINPAPLRYDIERTALDAYSVVQEERLARRHGEFQQRDHRDALMTAIDAVDVLRLGKE